MKKPSSVVISDQSFFDPGTSTSDLSFGVTVVGADSSLVQTTGEAAVVSGAANKSATRPVEGLVAGMATQLVEAPSAGNAALQSDSEEDLQSEPGSPVDDNFLYGSPDKDLNRDDSGDQELSEEASYRETIRYVRSFMGWHKIPEFESVSSSNDNPFAGS